MEAITSMSLGVVEGWVMAVAMLQPGRKESPFSPILSAGVAGLWSRGEGLLHTSIQTQVLRSLTGHRVAWSATCPHK